MRPFDAAVSEADLLLLEAFLALPPTTDTAMSVSMIDGMLTAAVIGPRAVMPSEFIPWIWDHEKGQVQPLFEDEVGTGEIFSIIMGMQNRVAAALNRVPPEFAPLFLVNDRWSHVEWADGFDLGMNFAVEAWGAAIDAKKSFFGPIVSLGEANLRDTIGDDWLEFLQGLERSVVGFRDHFRGETRAEFFAAHTPFVRSGPKVSRNDPCPCGSGRKYKKCCGDGSGSVH
jgi:uncharacterized protein